MQRRGLSALQASILINYDPGAARFALAPGYPMAAPSVLFATMRVSRIHYGRTFGALRYNASVVNWNAPLAFLLAAFVVAN
jgi:hypothetical protein